MTLTRKTDIDMANALIPLQPEPVAEAKAAWTVMRYATNAADAALLLDALDLTARQAVAGRKLAHR